MIEIEKHVQDHGLVILASIRFLAGEEISDISGIPTPATLVLAGNAGSDFWKIFSQSSEFLDGRPDPLDRWSRRVGEQVALACGVQVLFPFDGPPWAPFQRWAVDSGDAVVSRLSMVMHGQYGLWHAYRFALVLEGGECPPDQQPPFESPCLSCRDQPCLSACPVGAFSGESYQVEACAAHLADNEQGACMQTGCLSRHACPWQSRWRYQPEHARFHMQAFLSSRPGK